LPMAMLWSVLALGAAPLVQVEEFFMST